MSLQIISAKNVRLNLAKIWKAVENGASFQVIHRSRPICRIVPDEEDVTARAQPQKYDQKPLNSLDHWINIPDRLRFKSDKSAAEIIREIRDE